MELKWKLKLTNVSWFYITINIYSTVTDCFSTNTFDPKNSNKKDVESILFSFDLIIRNSKLTKTFDFNVLIF